MQERLTLLVREATTLDYIAEALAREAVARGRRDERAAARTLRRMSRELRVKAMMRRGQAAAILGRELPAVASSKRTNDPLR